MIIGTPKETKNNENRVGLTPESVLQLVADGHQVLIEKGAGEGIGASDAEYVASGARIVANAPTVFAEAELIVKVKEPQPREIAMLQSHHTLFTYLHLAADMAQTQGLLKSSCTAIAYETVTDQQGGLPLLAPMSEVAGRMSVQVGAYFLQKPNGGSGVLLGGVPGVAPGKVCVIGAGVSGANAVEMAVGLGADVTVLDLDPAKLRKMSERFLGRVKTLYANSANTERAVIDSDLVIGAVLVPGAKAPKLVSKASLSKMRKGSVLVDIAIDQGGCFATSRPTTHADPVYSVDGILHYCVTNMPGAVARTSTYALNNATLPYTRKIASMGWNDAMTHIPGLANGLNIHKGKIVHPAVLEAFPTLAA